MLRLWVRNYSGRTPLIKFRQGRAPEDHRNPTQHAAPQGKPGVRPTASAPVIEDWQLPAKYRRRPISEDECQAINLGGAI